MPHEEEEYNIRRHLSNAKKIRANEQPLTDLRRRALEAAMVKASGLTIARPLFVIRSLVQIPEAD